ncbi:pyrroline-5-carboxylate reductase family protein [Tsuneonella mangrovi]|uniref:pyrroline-5-carboxylate reductase family protein n=1 Tax=Tsuneonella mangrovi TaxID=1982042 RepID=UPI000BA227F2|nr:pyrroline-5-carboxylate reductase [Tsuneonella mangrovi]
MSHFQRILIVGFGTMVGAMVDGWRAAGVPADTFTIYHPTRADAPDGMTLVNAWPEGEPFDAVLLGVKPQKLGDVAPGLEPIVGRRTVFVSILAGVELDSLARRFPRAGGIARLMPNLAVALGKSPNALVAQGLSEDQRATLTEMAAMLGTAEWLEDEAQFDLVTALAGSGPGFVYRFIDALAAGATRLGLDHAQAERLAVQMVEGAAALAAQSPDPPGELARRVASPGGMTQKGLDVLDENDALARLLTETLRATRDRGREMAEAARDEG